MFESDILKRVRAFASRIGFVTFRNNVGVAWQGNRTTRMPNGALVIMDPRPIRFGLFKGSSDSIGWRSVIITPDMVGKRVAIFSAIETKRLKGKAADEQDTFLSNVREAGGIGILAFSEADIERGLTAWTQRR